MTPAPLALLLGGALVVLALAGPTLLRQAAPALVRVPRLAITVVGSSIVLWLVSLLAIGPLLAWAGSGPALLPVGAAEVCRRCLAAANPFPAAGNEAVIPSVLLLVSPVVLVLALGAGIIGQMVRRARRSREAVGRLLDGAQQKTVHGHQVWVVEADHPFALTFPARHGGIVLSTRAVHVLDDDELVAVLVHESTHLRQRHHLISILTTSTAVFLRWVPLIAAAADALSHYLEIAADEQACRRVGTPALVSALIKLGEQAHPPTSGHTCAEALHAAGPERIRQLVRPAEGMTGAVSAVAVATCLAVLVVVNMAVHLPYAAAALTGCI